MRNATRKGNKHLSAEQFGMQSHRINAVRLAGSVGRNTELNARQQ
jgi:hypothetical protein